MNELTVSNEIVGFGEYEKDVRNSLTDIKIHIKDAIGILNNINKDIEEIIGIKDPKEFYEKIDDEFCEWDDNGCLTPKERNLFDVKTELAFADDLIASIQNMKEKISVLKLTKIRINHHYKNI